MGNVVHLIAARLKPDADPAAIDHAVTLAHALRHAPGARRVIIGRGEQALVSVTWLDGRDALEPFAAAQEHMAFIMRGLAPCISSMWSAAVESETSAPPEASPMAALWVFALPESATLYEWQVRDLIRDIETLPGIAAAGPTAEERERYRAGGVVCLGDDEVEPFRHSLASAQARWGEAITALTHTLVDVVPPPAAASAT